MTEQEFLDGIAENCNYARAMARRMGDWRDVDDLVADVVMHAWANRKWFDPTRGNFAQWYCSLAQRRLIDVYRKRKSRRKGAKMLQAFDWEQGKGHTDRNTLEEQEQVDRLASKVEGLEDKAREIVALRARGLSLEEVAVALGIPTGTVKSHMYRDKVAGQITGETE